MKKDIIIHIGLHKTGTTFLQAMVFPELKNIFARSLHMLPKSESSPFNQILTGKFADMNAQELEYLKRDIYNYIDSSVNDSNIILSREDFTRHFHIEYDAEKSNKIFDFLKKIFPNMKIFLMIRKQDDWINSIYNQLLKNPQSLYFSLNEFIGYKRGKFIENKIGRENIYILPYEMFKENPKEFLLRFYEHYNIEQYFPAKKEVRVNFKGTYIPLFLYKSYCHFRERLPNVFKKFLRKNDKGFLKWAENYNGIKIKIPKLSKKQAEQVMEIHRESNKKLAEYIGMDLSQYGYY